MHERAAGVASIVEPNLSDVQICEDGLPSLSEGVGVQRLSGFVASHISARAVPFAKGQLFGRLLSFRGFQFISE